MKMVNMLKGPQLETHTCRTNRLRAENPAEKARPGNWGGPYGVRNL